jgi:hypothetical protein
MQQRGSNTRPRRLPYRLRHWARWWHLACGVPAEHVGHVLDLSVGEVSSSVSLPAHVGTAGRDRMLTLRRQGVQVTAIAAAFGVCNATVHRILSRGPVDPEIPTGPPRRRPASGVLGQLGRHVRRFLELGYDADRIAELLALNPLAVRDFVSRITPARKESLVKPREHREERRLRAHQAAVAERRRLIVTPPAGWSAADRANTGQGEEWARFLKTIKLAKASAVDVLGLAERLYYAPPRPTEAPAVEPAVWTGETNVNLGNPKLTEEMRAEMRTLRLQGWSTPKLAKRYGVSRATVCYALLGRTFCFTPPPALPRASSALAQAGELLILPENP